MKRRSIKQRIYGPGILFYCQEYTYEYKNITIILSQVFTQSILGTHTNGTKRILYIMLPVRIIKQLSYIYNKKSGTFNSFDTYTFSHYFDLSVRKFDPPLTYFFKGWQLQQVSRSNSNIPTHYSYRSFHD